MAKRIRAKIKKLRRGYYREIAVLPFYEDDDQPPYSEEIARWISIEVKFDSDFALLQ